MTHHPLPRAEGADELISRKAALSAIESDPHHRVDLWTRHHLADAIRALPAAEALTND